AARLVRRTQRRRLQRAVLLAQGIVSRKPRGHDDVLHTAQRRHDVVLGELILLIVLAAPVVRLGLRRRSPLRGRWPRPLGRWRRRRRWRRVLAAWPSCSSRSRRRR